MTDDIEPDPSGNEHRHGRRYLLIAQIMDASSLSPRAALTARKSLGRGRGRAGVFLKRYMYRTFLSNNFVL